MKTYGLYDVNDYECLVLIGNINDLSRYTGESINNIRCCLSRGLRVSKRYEVAKLDDYEDEPTALM